MKSAEKCPDDRDHNEDSKGRQNPRHVFSLAGGHFSSHQRRPVALSLRTPLNFLAAFVFFAGFFTAMNSPLALLRLVHALAPVSLVFN
jgi:hypothetical protein